MRCPEQLITSIRIVQRPGSTVIPWRLSLGPQVVKPACKSDDDDDEHQSSHSAPNASQRHMHTARYPRARYLTAYRANTNDLYDWTVVTFKAAVDSLDAIYGLLDILRPQNSTDFVNAAIARRYQRLMHSAVTVLTRAPLQLTITLIDTLMVLDAIRNNKAGEEKLEKTREGIEGKAARRRSMIHHPPDKGCVIELIEASEQLWQNCDRVLCLQPVSKEIKCGGFLTDEPMNDVMLLVACLHAFFSGYVASLFAYWAREAAIQGSIRQAAGARMLSDRLFDLVGHLTIVTDRFFDDVVDELTPSEIMELTEL